MEKVLVFDLAEVYLQGFYGIERQLEGVLDLSGEEIWERMNGGEEFWEIMRGEISEEEFWRRLVLRSGIELSVDFLKGAVRRNFVEIDGMRSVLEDLRGRGFEMALISDHAREWIEYCEGKFGYRELFDYVQYSYEVGVCKKDARAFEILLERFGKRAKECLFIDDSARNVELARGMGFDVIRFEGVEGLLGEFFERGIL